jgi:hypothetical protein
MCEGEALTAKDQYIPQSLFLGLIGTGHSPLPPWPPVITWTRGDCR